VRPGRSSARASEAEPTPGDASPPSDPFERKTRTHGRGDMAQVLGIGRHAGIPTPNRASHDGDVDYVRVSGSFNQRADLSCESLVHHLDITQREESREIGLPWSASPHGAPTLKGRDSRSASRAGSLAKAPRTLVKLERPGDEPAVFDASGLVVRVRHRVGSCGSTRAGLTLWGVSAGSIWRRAWHPGRQNRTWVQTYSLSSPRTPSLSWRRS
jgi:hypothetical protein